MNTRDPYYILDESGQIFLTAKSPKEARRKAKAFGFAKKGLRIIKAAWFKHRPIMRPRGGLGLLSRIEGRRGKAYA